MVKMNDCLCPPPRMPTTLLANAERSLMTTPVFSVVPVSETTYRLIYRNGMAVEAMALADGTWIAVRDCSTRPYDIRTPAAPPPAPTASADFDNSTSLDEHQLWKCHGLYALCQKFASGVSQSDPHSPVVYLAQPDTKAAIAHLLQDAPTPLAQPASNQPAFSPAPTGPLSNLAVPTPSPAGPPLSVSMSTPVSTPLPHSPHASAHNTLTPQNIGTPGSVPYHHAGTPKPSKDLEPEPTLSITHVAVVMQSEVWTALCTRGKYKQSGLHQYMHVMHTIHNLATTHYFIANTSGSGSSHFVGNVSLSEGVFSMYVLGLNDRNKINIKLALCLHAPEMLKCTLTYTNLGNSDAWIPASSELAVLESWVQKRLLEHGGSMYVLQSIVSILRMTDPGVLHAFVMIINHEMETSRLTGTQPAPTQWTCRLGLLQPNTPSAMSGIRLDGDQFILLYLHFYSNQYSQTSREPVATIPFTYGLKNKKFDVFRRFLDTDFKWLPELNEVLKHQFELARKTDDCCIWPTVRSLTENFHFGSSNMSGVPQP